MMHLIIKRRANMVNYRDQKSNKKFSRFLALSLCAWLTITSIASAILFYFQYKLNFKTSFTQVSSYLTLYQQRALILIATSIFIALFLLIIYRRIFAFKCHLFIRTILAVIPTAFIAALSLLSFNIYLILLELNIPFGQGLFTLRKYLQNFSTDLVLQAITTLPYQLNSIKTPLYIVIYSYLSMFTSMIFLPLQISFSANSIWKKFNALLILSFVILLGISAYYLIIHFIINDPFLPYESLFQYQ